jgi:HK97 family phage prohead protease
LPLLFGHAPNNPSTVVGMAAPGDLWADERGLWLRGWLDTTDSLGQRFYRMVQKGVLTWSVGFRPARKHREAGVTVFDEVDELLEVSLTPIPANSRTFTASAKAAAEDRDVPSLEELREQERDLRLTGDEEERERVREETRRWVREVFDHSAAAADAKAVRAKAEQTAREVGPITVASFPC